MSNETKQAPIQTFRDGGVVVKLWRQDGGENGPFVSATIGRTYRDPKSNEYRESRSLGGTDMLKAQALLGEAHREALKWREYFRETEGTQDPPRDKDRSANLVEERDAVMAQAKSPDTGRGREPSR